MIAFFGGGFDPIHYGHITCIDFVLKTLVLKKLYLLPYTKSPHKAKLFFSSQQREDMLKLVCASDKKLAVDLQEIKQKITNYTINTLENIHKTYPQEIIILLMGADSFVQLNTWKDYQRLHCYCHIGVFRRSGYLIKAKYHFIKTEDSNALYQRKNGLLFLLKQPIVTLSSDSIRAKIEKKEDLTTALPEAIIKYLYEIS